MNASHDVSALLVRELRAFQREILLFPGDDLVWSTAPGVSNSAGNLALHIAGNLRHFVGAVLGGIPYTRDREEEFGRRSGTREEIVGRLEAAIDAVQTTLAGNISAGEFPNPPGGHRVQTGPFLLHLCTHTAYHLGQAGYLRRVLTGDARTSNALSLGEITPSGRPSA